MGEGWLRTADRVGLAWRSWPSATPDAPRAAVVLVHGFCSGKDDPDVNAVASRLADGGLEVIAYDARGHGPSGGLCTLGNDERHDVAAAVEAARLRSSRVVLVGASMGAIAVLRHAAIDPDLAGVVVVSCPARWRLPRNARGVAAALLTQTRPGRWGARRWFRVRLARRWTRAEPPVTLAGLVTAPLAVVHGAADQFIPATDAALLGAVGDGPRRLDVVPGMGHAFDGIGLGAIADAVEWVLEAAVPSQA